MTIPIAVAFVVLGIETARLAWSAGYKRGRFDERYDRVGKAQS